MMNDQLRYVVKVCEVLIDDAVNDRTRKNGWFSVLELMQGVQRLHEIVDVREDDGK